MRSVIYEANEEGIRDIVNQQFKFAKTICDGGLVPKMCIRDRVINEMKEGVNLKLVSRMVENDFKLHGYDLIHALGHGVGLQIHEFPYASTRVDFVLKNNMIVTDEPGIYIPNQFGVRIEDTVLVNRGMSTSLTKSEKDYVIVDA